MPRKAKDGLSFWAQDHEKWWNQRFTHLFACASQTWKIFVSGWRSPLTVVVAAKISKANILKTTDLISINLFHVTHFCSSATYKKLGSTNSEI